MRRREGRLSLRERLERNQRAICFRAGVPYHENELQKSLPPKRDRVRRPVDQQPVVPLEKEVLAAVGDLLESHPQVLLAIRQNSGAMPYESHGRLVPVWFYKILRRPEDLTIVDYWGFLRSGKPFAMECKRADWKGPSPTDKREMKQQAFIRMIECIGGVGGFVRSADEAQAILQ